MICHHRGRGMTTLTVAERLRALSADLASAEQKVARTLFSSRMIAGLDTVASLAARAKVSGPTVIRLTAKLGFPKYEDFQREVRGELEAQRQSPLSMYPGSRNRPGDTLGKHAEVFTLGIRDTFDRLSTGDFSNVIDSICDMRRGLFLAGGRVSQLAAQMLFVHLFQMRPGVRMIQTGLQPRGDQLLEANHASTLIMFDFRRYQADSVSLSRAAKDQGAEIILITDPWQSPIADFADHVLVADVSSPSAYDSLVPTFALIEAIITDVLARLDKKAIIRIKHLEGLRAGFEWNKADEAGRRKARQGKDERPKRPGK